METPLRLLILAAIPDTADAVAAHFQGRYQVTRSQTSAAALQAVERAAAYDTPFTLCIIAAHPTLPPVFAARVAEASPQTELLTLPDQLTDPDAIIAAIEGSLLERHTQAATAQAGTLTPLLRLGTAFGQQPSLVQGLVRLYQELLELAGDPPLECIYTALYDPRQARWVFPCLWVQGRFVRETTHPAARTLADTPAGWVYERGRAWEGPGLPTAEGDPWVPFWPQSCLITPLLLGGQVRGVLGIQSAQPDRLTNPVLRQVVQALPLILAGAIGEWWTALQYWREQTLLDQFLQTISAAPDAATIVNHTAVTARNLTRMAAGVVVSPAGTTPLLGGDPVHQDTATALQQLTVGPYGPPAGTDSYEVLQTLIQQGWNRVSQHRLRTSPTSEAGLWLLSPTEHRYDGSDKRATDLTIRISEQALNQVHIRNQYAQLLQAIGSLTALHTQAAPAPSLIAQVLDMLKPLLGWTAAGYWRRDPIHGRLVCVWHTGDGIGWPLGALALDHPWTKLAYQPGTQSWETIPEPADQEHPGVRAVLTLRRNAEDPPGLLLLQRMPGSAFTEAEQALLGLVALLLAGGLARHHLIRLHKAQQHLAQALARAEGSPWDAITQTLSQMLPGGHVALIHPEAAGTWVVRSCTWGTTSRAASITTTPWSNPSWAAQWQHATHTHSWHDGIVQGIAVPVGGSGSLLGWLHYWQPVDPPLTDTHAALLDHAAAYVQIVLRTTDGSGISAPARLTRLWHLIRQIPLWGVDSATFLHQSLRIILETTAIRGTAIYLRGAADVVEIRVADPPDPAMPWSEAVQRQASRVARTPGQGATYTTSPAGTYGFIPLPRDGRTRTTDTLARGVLVVFTPAPGGLSPVDQAICTEIAAEIGWRLSDIGLADLQETLYALNDQPDHLDQALPRLPGLLCRILNLPACLLHQVDTTTQQLAVTGYAGIADPSTLAALAVPLTDPTWLSWVYRLQHHADGPAASGMQIWDSQVWNRLGVRFGEAVPIWQGTQVFGVLSMHTHDGYPLDAATRQALHRIARYLSATLANVQLAREHTSLITASRALGSETVGGDAAADPALQQLLEVVRYLSHHEWVALYQTDNPTGGEAWNAIQTVTSPNGTPKPLAPAQPWHPEHQSLLHPESCQQQILPIPPSGTASATAVLVLESRYPVNPDPRTQATMEAITHLIGARLLQYHSDQQRVPPLRTLRYAVDALAESAAQDAETALPIVLYSACQILQGDLGVFYPAHLDANPVPAQWGATQAGALAGAPAMHQIIQQLLQQPTDAAPFYVVDSPSGAVEHDRPEWFQAEHVQTALFIRIGQPTAGMLVVGYRHPQPITPAIHEGMHLLRSWLTYLFQFREWQDQHQALIHQERLRFNLVAHELLEPLELLHMLLSMSLDQADYPLEPEVREHLERARQLVGEEHTVVDSILMLTRLQQSHHVVRRRPVLVAKLLAGATAVVAQQAHARQVSITAQLDPLLRERPVTVDAPLLQVAIKNVLHNAVKFSPAGTTVNMRSALVCEPSGPPALEIMVLDKGSGIPQAVQGRIFEPYIQGTPHQGTGRSGVGLGLPLTRLIMKHLGGTIRMHSEPDHGTQFVLCVPVPDTPPQTDGDHA